MTENTQKEIRVAKIGAWQAIAVASITAFAGVAGGFFVAGGATQPSGPTQRWLVVRGVTGSPEVTGSLDYPESIRIVARVNNIIYAYPADVFYTPITTDMAEQKMPLPATAGPYTISFEADIQDGPSFQSRETPQFVPTALPTGVQRYDMMQIKADRRLGGARTYMTPQYNITVLYGFE